ncbi:hypothetical protein [Mycobacterium simiae]|uniref:Uncharacterized protein n=1 Tax=Mycobacterium simiae TaxID=1784 RepID=A0A1X0Y124_MYCSI|nr:hypothetical protein [Mycobacterium simiae]ORJ58843.1 hypothetical protein B5M45_17000 [Mycobacterium simiae]
MASGLEFGYAYTSSLIDTSEERCPECDVAFYQPTTHPGARLPHAFIATQDGSHLSTHEVIASTGLTLFTADPQCWGATLAETPLTVPIAVVALSVPSNDHHAALIELFEVGDLGAVVVRPDGHVVWGTDIDVSAADRLLDFIERAWSGVYRTSVPNLQEAP